MPETRQKLLLAAGDVFSRKGFRAATVREICAGAGTNVAAVNYHFGGKDRLYQAVLEFASQEARERYPGTTDQDASPPEQRLCSFVRTLLLRLFAKGQHAWYDKLMAREAAAPTPIFENFITLRVAPRFALLTSIVAELMGPDADQATVQLCAQSVIGQCRNFYLSRQVIQRLVPHLVLNDAGVQALAEHIASFSLAAIRNYGHPTALSKTQTRPDAGAHPTTLGGLS